MMRRKYWVVVLAFVGLFMAIDTVYWQLASARLRDDLQDWLAARRAQGWEVDASPVTTGGWPQAARVRIPKLTMRHAGSDIPGDVRWVSEGVDLSVSLYHPSTLDVAFTGLQHVKVGNGPEATVAGSTMALSMPLGQQDPQPINLHAKDLRIDTAAEGWRVTVGLLDAVAAISSNATQSQPAVGFSVVAEAIALPLLVKWPLGANISSLSTAGALNGPVPRVRNATVWAEAWRDGGGSLEISRFTLGWGSLGLTSAATLALDEQLQPMGSGSSRLVGYVETLDRLAASGVLSRSAATAAKAVLSLLAGAGETDTPSSVDVPLTLQYRTLSMRQVPLVRLPELDWPAR